ncbi:MAG: hypothetical protein F6K40_12365 [Okeania sp. SIO3I5]|uniref:hypothetical protein n=1 Tax=Okeania sp. SIO3I5 TaxID=2607805 RepID=UPI0013B6D90A|nr:hypothetical protein [Okeania sp. SIO3I5]NEQ37024.1 hypothetical protein [Okeania sp. SIO3I5]
MKQISVSIPDYIYKVLVFLTDVSGKSQSAICTPWVEQGILHEFSKYKETHETLERLNISLDDDKGN